jgi:uncharacterized protein with PQ loop repeat
MELDVLLVLSLIGACMVVLLSLSPVPAFIKANHTNSVKEISRGFIVVSNLTAIAWVLYALKAQILDIFVPNIMQFCISLVLITVYHYLRGDPVVAMAKYCSALCMCATVCIKWGNPEDLGILAVILTILNNLAPMDQVIPAIRERRADYLDMTVNSASFFCNCIWLAFGMVSRNLYVVLPNIFGICASLFLFGLFIWAKARPSGQTKDDVDETSHLSTV